MQEFYHELVVRPSSHHSLFSDFLSDTLPVGFEELNDTFIIRSEDELETIAWGIEQFAEALSKALEEPVDVETQISKKQNSDWIANYQESITPVEVASFYIHPTWNDPKEGALNIAIDPALAFGTGHHPTTASCLEAIALSVNEGESVLDVGCGSGILAIAAAKKGAIVDACDTDIASIDNTKINAELNNVELHEVWEGSASLSQNHYDVVIANIVADVLVFIEKDLKRVLKPKAKLILSGILDKYEAKVLHAYDDCAVIQRIAQDEWVTLILQK